MRPKRPLITLLVIALLFAAPALVRARPAPAVEHPAASHAPARGAP